MWNSRIGKKQKNKQQNKKEKKSIFAEMFQMFFGEIKQKEKKKEEKQKSPKKGEFTKLFQDLQKEGFSRVRIDGQTCPCGNRIPASGGQCFPQDEWP